MLGGWGGKCSVKDFCRNLSKNIDKRSSTDRSRELFPVFHNPHRKGLPSSSAVALTLEYIVEVPSKAPSSVSQVGTEIRFRCCCLSCIVNTSHDLILTSSQSS